MSEQLLDRVLREIRERMSASQAAAEESRRLEAALAALEQPDGGGPKRAEARPQRATHPGVSTRKRAGRGENLRRIREVIEERPGATAGELSAATGISRPTVASTLGKLVQSGELERRELPGGRAGFRRRRDGSGAGNSPGADAGTEAAKSD